MSAIEKPGPTGADDWAGFVLLAVGGDAAAVGVAATLDWASTTAGAGAEAAGNEFSAAGRGGFATAVGGVVG